jgi:uncharacterized protein YpmB
MKNKKGSALVEASLVIPVILLTIMALIGVITDLYEKTTVSYQEHRQEMVQEEEEEMMGEAKRMADLLKGLI